MTGRTAGIGGVALILLLWGAVEFDLATPLAAVVAGLSIGLFAVLLMRAAADDVDSARREALELRQARERARATASTALRAKIVEGFSQPLLILDENRKVLEANREARELLGEELLDRDLALHLRAPPALEAIAATLSTGAPAQAQIRLTTPTERHFGVRVTKISDESNGEPITFIVVALHDLTEIKKAERIRVDFVANASHELRTPLASLIGFIETLRGPARDDPEARERFLDIMQQEGDRMVRLIDDLLSLSRIEREKHVRPSTTVNIRDLVESVERSMVPSLGDDDRKLEIKADAQVPIVLADRDQIVQVLQNLLSNALKYGRPHTPIRIVVEQDPTDPDFVRTTVIDEGEGIAPENLSRLTERFFRVDTARSRQLGGTGLGLAIVKHIVERHRGRLKIESELGVGTRVSFTLPVAREQPERIARGA